MDKTFSVELVAPDGSIFNGDALRFRAPGVLGSFEILKDHAPLISATDIGPVYITTPDGERITFAASRGFVEVIDNRVIMIVGAAEPAEKIDVERAKEAETRARERLESGEEEASEESREALERARNRLRIAMSGVSRKN